MFFATLCGGHLDSEDTLELENAKKNMPPLAFGPLVNLFTYFAVRGIDHVFVVATFP